VAWVTGLVLILPPNYFRAFHFAHHRHTQDPASDPELAGGAPVGLRTLIWRLSGIPYWVDAVRTLLRHAVRGVDAPYIAARRRPAIVREARIYLGVYALGILASILTGSWAMVLFWLAPAVFAQPVLRAYLLAEHTGLPLEPDMLRNSRSIRSNPLVRMLAWNMPFHAEHHAYPGVPFHALPALSRDLRPHIEHCRRSYLAVLVGIFSR
jgi:fatty acid desaturase